MLLRKKKKKQQGSPLLAIFMTLGFIWLAHSSLQHEEASYKHSVFSAVQPRMSVAKAKALQELYNISDEEIAKPVTLFGESSN